MVYIYRLPDSILIILNPTLLEFPIWPRYHYFWFYYNKLINLSINRHRLTRLWFIYERLYERMTIFLPPKLNTYRLNACTFGISYHSWQPIECELENKSTSSTRKKKDSARGALEWALVWVYQWVSFFWVPWFLGSLARKSSEKIGWVVDLLPDLLRRCKCA